MTKIKRILSTIAMSLTIYGGVAFATEAKTTKIESAGVAVFKQASPSVLLVKSKIPNGSLQGSGVVFRNGFKKVGKSYQPVSSWIVTNAHVVAGSTSVTVATGNAQYSADVKYIDESLDLALLLVPDAVIVPAKIMNANKAAVGDRVFAIGSPVGLANSISEGILSAHRVYKGANVVQTTAPISSGNSGGGLFDSKGRLIGITTFKLKSGESLNFAIDSGYANVLIEAEGATELILGLAELFGGFEEWKSNPAKLTKWLMGTKADDGTPMYEYFEQKFMSSLNSGVDGTKGLLFEIREKYLRSAASTSKATEQTLASKNTDAKQESYRLMCPMFVTRTGEFFRDLYFDISVAESKVNNSPATFTTDEIICSMGEKFEVRINRYTGFAIYGNKERPGFFRGQCVKVEQRQF